MGNEYPVTSENVSSAPVHSIVINTYERPQLLSQCLRALTRQKGIDDHEVVVIDDGSEGDFKAVERLWTNKLNLRYIKIKHGGRSAARNRGLRSARGKRVLFLGDDIIVRQGWLESHLQRGEDDPRIAVLGPAKLDASQKYPPAMRHWVDPVHLENIKDPNDAGFEFFMSGNISADREFLIELGGFDERFAEYGWEDIDLGYRFAAAGGRIVFEEDARATHMHPAMNRAQLWKREYEAGITAWQFWDKWQTDDIRFMKFWAENSNAGPEWRRALGRAAIGLIEKLAPNSDVLPKLYERLIYSYRHLGVEEARRRFLTQPDHSKADQTNG